MLNFKDLQYHHYGFILDKPREGMIHYPDAKIWTSDIEKSEFHIEFIHFEKDAEYHPLIKAKNHVGFIVKNMEEAIKGYKVLKEPTMFGTIRFCFIEDHGVPIEFWEL